MKIRVVLAICGIVVGIVLLGLWRSLQVYDEYGPETIEIAAGDGTNLGFTSVFFLLRKGDLINIISTVKSPVSFVIVTNDSYLDWRSKYCTANVTSDMMTDYPSFGNGTLTSTWHFGETGHDEYSFVASADGRYVWVLLNNYFYRNYVTYMADVTHTYLQLPSIGAFYGGILSSLISTVLLAFFMRSKS